MDFSLFLAKALGLYLLIISLSILFNKNRMPAIINGIIQNPALQLILGFNVLIIGILLVVSHNVWSGTTWQIVISVIAWIIFIKGLLYVAFPRVLQSMTNTFMSSTAMLYFSILVNLILGLYLCYYGFIAV